MFNKRKSNEPRQDQQTGQWHFYDDEGKPIDLKEKKPAQSDDEVDITCCFGRRR